jgi:putative transposase
LVRGVDRSGLWLPIAAQAGLLGIARQSVYYTPVPVSEKELEIKNQIDVIYTKHPFFGVRKMTVAVSDERKEAINHKRIQAYMNEMGLQAIFPGPNLSKNGMQHPVFPYLLRDVVADHPNHIWGTDITYIRMKNGFVYLVAFLDWFSRFVVSWRIATTLDIEFVLEAGRAALETYGNPEFENSDQGSHFTSPQYIELWNQDKTNISMDGRGRCMDNIFTERLWRTVKYEEVYLKSYETVAEAMNQIGAFMEFYNYERPHQSLAYKTPAGIYFQ